MCSLTNCNQLLAEWCLYFSSRGLLDFTFIWLMCKDQQAVLDSADDIYTHINEFCFNFWFTILIWTWNVKSEVIGFYVCPAGVWFVGLQTIEMYFQDFSQDWRLVYIGAKSCTRAQKTALVHGEWLTSSMVASHTGCTAIPSIFQNWMNSSAFSKWSVAMMLPKFLILVKTVSTS